MMRASLLLPLIIFSTTALSQFTNNVWCFGDSAGIDFSDINNPVSISSNLRTRGSCVSISDANSNLMFYAYTRPGMIGESTLVIDSSNSIMLNGSNIVGQAWYNELLILPKPGNSQLFYLLSNGITNSGLEGLYYSIVDLSLNGGLGAVIQTNTFLTNDDLIDAMIGIKHGNGIDWWLIVHLWNGTNTFRKYLISESGINLYSTQNIGQIFNTDVGRFAYSYVTNKFISISANGQIQKLDFDRCTGDFSNVVFIENPSIYSKIYVGCSISPNGNVAYVSNTNNIFGDSLTLYQYDLTATNIAQSRQTIYKQVVPASGGLHALGPDGKIYISCLYEYGYPYADTLHNLYTDNISVINHPDSLGLACDFQPFSFNLGGRRAYWGLPNNPDYSAGAWSGSACDTLVGTHEPVVDTSPAAMFVFYAPEWQSAFVNAQQFAGSGYQLEVFDIMGKSVFRESGKLNPPYFTKNLNCSSFAKGVYTVVLITEKERLVKRFVKE